MMRISRRFLVAVVPMLGQCHAVENRDAVGTIRPDGGHDDPAAPIPSAPPVIVSPDAPVVGDGPFDDFPRAPLVVSRDGGAGAPLNAPSLFADDGGGRAGGSDPRPCIVEPESGALIPSGWLRPRIRWEADPQLTLFEVRIHADNERNDFIVYTSDSSWTLPLDTWNAMLAHPSKSPISVAVRGIPFDGSSVTGAPSVSASSTFLIAPASASGSIVYWTTTGGSALKGFSAGDESVVDVIKAADIETPCIGCHVSAPDGKSVIFAATDSGNGTITRLALASANRAQFPSPSLVSASARTLLATTSQQLPTVSRGHWSDGDHVVVSTLITESQFDLDWIDLEATSTDRGVGWGILDRTADPGKPIAPAFDHAGTRIAYTSAAEVLGSVNMKGADLYVIPFANRKGGTATPIDGASDSNFNEFYPAFSPDDRWIAFSRNPGTEETYDNPKNEIFVIGAAGGMPVRLAANDPPVCSGVTSPGITNSFPKWAPETPSINGRTYYWLAFSSRRAPSKRPQLYLAGMVEEGGKLTTYPAVYLWNQPADEDNHTPAWDVFKIPPAPIPSPR